MAFALLFAQLQFREINALNLYLSGTHVGDTMIAWHNIVWLWLVELGDSRSCYSKLADRVNPGEGKTFNSSQE